jgi:DNA-binding winged helix-turn-helix (wHTH) protein
VDSKRRDGEGSSFAGYSFGDGAFDVGARQWIAKGAARTLEPKPFALLSYLIEHRHRAVTRAELLRAVWGDAAVCDGAIPQCVWTVRRMIGDTDGARPLITTLKGVGYRFVAPVREYRAPVVTVEASSRRTPDIVRPSSRVDVAWERLREAHDQAVAADSPEEKALRDLALACREFADAVLSME